MAWRYPSTPEGPCANARFGVDDLGGITRNPCKERKRRYANRIETSMVAMFEGLSCEDDTPAQRERAPVKMPAWQQCTPLRRFCVSTGLEAGHPTSLQCTENSALLRSHFGSIPPMFQAIWGSIVLPEAQFSIDSSAAVQHCTASLLPTSAEADAHIYNRILPVLPQNSDGLSEGQSYHVIRKEAGLFL